MALVAMFVLMNTWTSLSRMSQGYLESNEGDPELIVFIPWVSDFLCLKFIDTVD